VADTGSGQADQAVARDVTNALAGLGWAPRDARASAGRALACVREAGEQVTDSLVLAAALREAGEKKSAAVNPADPGM
jgi:hypothetical protein